MDTTKPTPPIIKSVGGGAGFSISSSAPIITPGEPTPNIYDLVSQASASALNSSTAVQDTSAITNALGQFAQQPAVNQVDPNALFGMMPDQIKDVAAQRTNSNYQNSLNAAQALKSIQEAQGVPEARALNNSLVKGEQERKSALELHSMNNAAHIILAKATGIANADPVKLYALNVIKRQNSGEKISAADANVAASIMDDSNMKMVAAAQTQMGYLDILYKDPMVRAQKQKELQTIMDAGISNFLGKVNQTNTPPPAPTKDHIVTSADGKHKYKYNGTGAKTDLKNYTEIKEK